jgi:hypothetical protein
VKRIANKSLAYRWVSREKMAMAFKMSSLRQRLLARSVFIFSRPAIG